MMHSITKIVPRSFDGTFLGIMVDTSASSGSTIVRTQYIAYYIPTRRDVEIDANIAATFHFGIDSAWSNGVAKIFFHWGAYRCSLNYMKLTPTFRLFFRLTIWTDLVFISTILRTNSSIIKVLNSTPATLKRPLALRKATESMSRNFVKQKVRGSQNHRNDPDVT